MQPYFSFGEPLTTIIVITLATIPKTTIGKRNPVTIAPSRLENGKRKPVVLQQTKKKVYYSVMFLLIVFSFVRPSKERQW